MNHVTVNANAMISTGINGWNPRGRYALAAVIALVTLGLVMLPAAQAHPDLGVRVVDTTECERSDDDDEWIEVRNDGDNVVDLTGWTLTDRHGLDSQFTFTFPDGFTLAHDESVKVWTDDEKAGDGVLTFNLDRPIWRNPDDGGDTAMLFDADGEKVHELECQNRIQVFSHDTGDAEAADAECVDGLVRNAHVFPERVNLTWSSVPDADTYHVYRQGPDGDWEHRIVTRNEGLIDGTVTPGESYTYVVTAHDPMDPEACVQAGKALDVSVIPFFPGAPALALATLAGLGAFIAARKR